jgi:hypothetical protein
MNTNTVNIRSPHTYLVLSLFWVATTLQMSTAAPTTALHRSVRCDVCSGGTARVNECVDMFDEVRTSVDERCYE